MKWNRRDLLRSATVLSASSLLEKWPAEGQTLSGFGDTVFAQGALGGGGYACSIDISPDGLTRVMHGDTYGASIWNSKTQAWQQLMKSPNMESVGAKYAYPGACHAIASAPSNSTRIYMCASTPNAGTGTGNIAYSWQTIFRSDDRGAHWSATSMRTFQGTNQTNRLSGPKIAVDPNNADIVYISNSTGVVFVTYNGGTNWQTVDALFEALPMQAASGSTPVGQTRIPFASNSITALVGTTRAKLGSGEGIFAYNRDAPLSLGSNSIYYDNVLSADDVHISVPIIEPRTFGGRAPTGSPGILAGDRIYFGMGCLIAIDGNSGTVANPGIALGVPGATGLASKNIYFGWCKYQLTDAMWWSQDGGSTFAAMTGKTPCQISHMRMSNDGTLAGGGGNILYVTDGSPNSIGTQNGWRYVATPPNGSGLSANTWTNLPVKMVNGLHVICPDPTTMGKVCCVDWRGNLCLSLDYGNTNKGFYNGAPTQLSGSENGAVDPPWMSTGCDGLSMGDAIFDPQVRGKLWILDGIGVWYTTPTHNATKPTWHSQTRGVESMIVQQIVKAPAPNGRILLACQDRPLFSIANSSTYPTSYHPTSQSIIQSGDIIYSDSDPTVLFASAGSAIYRSHDKGDHWVQIASNGKNGFVAHGALGGACCKLASTSPTSVMAQGSGNNPANIQYGTPVGDPNVGANWFWKPSLHNGNPVVGYGYLPFYLNNMKYLTSDGAGNYYYLNWTASGGGPAFYRSSDGGATFTLVRSGSAVNGLGAAWISGNLACVPGKLGHLFVTKGVNFSRNELSGQLHRSTDGGVSWATANFFYAWQVACGKGKPGKSYPAVYVTGIQTSGEAAGLFRSDDAQNASPTWTRLDNIRRVTLDAPHCLFADQETYGSIYIGAGSSGYCVGKIV